MRDLFERVRPLVGNVLESRQVVVAGSPAAAAVVEHLMKCGVRQWITPAGNEWLDCVMQEMRQQLGCAEMTCRFDDSTEEMAAADLALVVDDAALALRLPSSLSRLAVFTSATANTTRAFLALPGELFDQGICRFGMDESQVQMAISDTANDNADRASKSFDWLLAAPLVALMTRALLLRGSPYAMATWENAWARGIRGYEVGNGADPACVHWQERMATGERANQPLFRTPQRRQGTLLVVGLGTLGSVAAGQLALWVERVVLVDPDVVEIPNLVRQNYARHQVGQAKATALAASLGAANPGLTCKARMETLTSDDQVAALIREEGITAALVTTGTIADFAVSRALAAASLPHVVGRCYARARFWEGIVVDGAAGSSYEQVRRGVAAGPTPEPTPEEMAAYGAVGELAGEPASSMETGWAAMWLARLAVQMMSPAAMREGWLLARLAAGATCFVGGVVVELVEGGVAYGIAVPGQVHSWSVSEIG